MARRCAASKKKNAKEREKLESELEKYQGMIRDLMKSDESRLTKTKKQKAYHAKITQLQRQLSDM